ncbi:ISL3 family transposase [Vagococcus salmoninarum]|nr:ISL3 family transposase [Vagococcus salmoninarum]MBE9390474.1 ISL3 family transposase [Vagococcus salmoninarum]
MSNHIKKMLRITDENILVSNVIEKNIRGNNSLIIKASLTYMPLACINCGSTTTDSEGKRVIVKNGSKVVSIRLEPYQHLPTILELAKQRYHCKNCGDYWTAQTDLVQEKSFISNHTKIKILDLLSEKISMTLIAKLCSVSITTVIRILRSLSTYLPTPTNPVTLPKVLMVDEFRSHASLEDKMSFICADGETGKLIDILPSRKLNKLTHYFNRTTIENRENVQFLVTDMNAAYFQLTKKVFPSARLIIDRFHIVKHLNSAFNEFRVREMKRINQQNKKSDANKLKTNWKFLLKNSSNIDTTHYKTWRSFRSPKYPFLTEAMMIDRLLSLSIPLADAYESFQLLGHHFRTKNPEGFFSFLKNLPDNLDPQFKKKIENLLSYEEGITNSLIYSYSNGKIEAKNTHIKTLKRVSYGFKSFQNMRIRIFLTNGLIKIK